MYPLPVEPEALPTVVICPGGAYMFCSMENEGDAVALSFAKAGYQAFILQYTVGTTCGENDSKHPAQLLDLAEHNIPYELHVFQNGEHGFATGVPSGVGPYRVDKHQACSAWVDLATVWLMHWAAPETQEHDFCIADAMRNGGDTPPPFFA